MTHAVSGTASSPATPIQSRAELEAQLAARTSAASAVVQGARLALLSWRWGFPVALAYGAVSGALGPVVMGLVRSATDADPAGLASAAQAITGFGVLCTIYGGVQLAKRDRVSRASWWPALLAVPLLLIGGALLLEASGAARQYGPVVMSLVLMGWSIFLSTFAGAAAAMVWILSGAQVLDGWTPRAGALGKETVRRLLDIAGPHGARVLAVTLGAQLLLPGIFYAVQYAFTDCIVILDPDRPALHRSGQLAFGMKGRLFRLLLAWWSIGTLFTLAIAAALQRVRTMHGVVELVAASFVDPAAIPARTFLVQELVWALLTWVLTLALLVQYREREGQVRARTELKRQEAASGPTHAPDRSSSDSTPGPAAA